MIDWSGRRVLVTGATGMVGSWLCAELVRRGAAVTALVLDHNPQSEFFRSGLSLHTSIISGSLTDRAAVERAVLENDNRIILHLGAQTIVGVAKRAPISTFAANIEGTWNLLDVARLNPGGIDAVVVASSDKAYGSSEVLPYVEDMALQGRGPYDVSKSCTDLLATSYWHSYGLPMTIARCGNIFGGGDLNWSRIVPGTIRALLAGETPVLRSDGTFLRDYIHVDDVVTAYLTLADASIEGTHSGEAFNFSPERALTVREIYDATCIATVGELVEPVVLGGATDEIHDQYLSSEKARLLLGWAPSVSTEEGLRRTVEWYRRFLSQT